MPSSRKPCHSSRMDRSVGSCSSARNTPGPMACGVPGRHQHAVPGADRYPVQRADQRGHVLAGHPASQYASRDVVAEAQVDTGVFGAGGEHDPGFRLAVRAAQVGPAVGLVGVAVHGQPLAGVEQLDQQAGIGAVGRDVLGAEKPFGRLRDGIGQHPPVRQRAEPGPLLAERGRHRRDPVFRAVSRRTEPTETRDLRATLVEPLQLIGAQDEQRCLPLWRAPERSLTAN